MSEETASLEILADWRYAPDEWLDFVEYETENRGRLIGEIIFDNIFPVSIIITVLMLFCDLPDGILGVLAVCFLLIGFLFLSLSLFINRSEKTNYQRPNPVPAKFE